MMPDQLKQTDQSLIALLSDRRALATLELEQQVTDVASLVAQTNILESVSDHHVKPRRVTIIGGRGRMGRFFTEQLAAVGHNVSVLEQED